MIEQDRFKTIRERVSLQAYCDDRLARAAHGRGYVCPACGSGDGSSVGSDSAFSIKADRWKCFSCNAGGDVFDLAGVLDRTNDRETQLRSVASWARIELPGDSAITRKQTSKSKPKPKAKPAKNYAEGREQEMVFINRAKQHINTPEARRFFNDRSINPDDARALGWGYDPESDRLIITWPGCDYYHIDRKLSDDDLGPKYTKPASDKVGAQPLYNPEALKEPSFYVVEGAFDAAALETRQLPAVALGGTGAGQLIAELQKLEDKPTAILMLDRDKAGQEASERIARDMEAAGLPYRLMEYPEGIKGKDADEMLFNDDRNASFASWLHDFKAETERQAGDLKEEAYSAALAHLQVTDSLKTAGDLIAGRGAVSRVETGFKKLDGMLNGGIPGDGLTVLGATSSIGKTTFLVQMADQMAEAGRNVLFVTIEQSARELVAKSLSRITRTAPEGASWASSADEIADPIKREAWPQAKTEALFIAMGKYAERTGGRVRYLNGFGQPSAAEIRAVAEFMTAHDGQPPVVYIDYLQLLKPPSERDDDKRAVDKNVSALRQMARDLQTPVVLISSLNRSSYSGEVSQESFKESGGIEYGADLLLAMQPAKLAEGIRGETSEKKAKAKADVITREYKSQHVRETELRVLKHRNARVPDDGVVMTFHAAYSLMVEKD